MFEPVLSTLTQLALTEGNDFGPPCRVGRSASLFGQAFCNLPCTASQAGVVLSCAGFDGSSTLDLSGAGIMGLRDASVFDLRMPGVVVTAIDLSHNSLQSLPATVFDTVPQLQHLLLGHNPHLASLPDQLFGALANVTMLDLSGNTNMTAMPNLAVFAPLVHLEQLDMSDGGLTGQLRSPLLPPQLTALATLTLRGNMVTGFGAGAFAGMTGMRVLDVADNELEGGQGLAGALQSGLTGVQTL